MTVPDGVVVPLAVAVRVSVCPAVRGFGDATRTVVVAVTDAVTVAEVAAEVLARKLELPEYWAVRL